MFETIYSQVGVGIAMLVVIFGFLKGDEPERFASGAFGLVILVGLGVPIISTGAGGMPWGLMSLDLLLLAVFCGLAWHSRRTWLFWATAFQSLIVTGHILVLANLRPPADAFAAVNNMSNYGVLITMAIGTFWAWQERNAAGLK